VHAIPRPATYETLARLTRPLPPTPQSRITGEGVSSHRFCTGIVFARADALLYAHKPLPNGLVVARLRQK
jgi:hypothetical protein